MNRQNSQLNTKIDRRTESLAVGAQYGVTPVQAHTHNGIDSLAIPYLIASGKGAPVGNAPIGTLYIRTDPVDRNSRLYINTGGKSWVDIQASA